MRAFETGVPVPGAVAGGCAGAGFCARGGDRVPVPGAGAGGCELAVRVVLGCRRRDLFLKRQIHKPCYESKYSIP